MGKPVALEQMSAEEQQLEIERRIKAAWRIVIQSRNRRKQEEPPESSGSRAS